MPFPDIDPIAFQIGPLAVRWYGIAYAATFLIGVAYIKFLVKRPRFWPSTQGSSLFGKVDDLFLFVVAGVIIGGRLGHVLLYRPAYYFSNPLEILAVWEGGMSFHGGLLGTAVAIILFAKTFGFNKWSIADLIAACTPLGILLVRSANFVNGEIVGSPSELPWAIVFPGYDEPRHPAMLYEAALEGAFLLAIITALIFRLKITRFPGLTASVFLIGYSIARIFCEFFKFADHRMIWENVAITKGMAYSAPMLALGVAIAYSIISKQKDSSKNHV